VHQSPQLFGTDPGKRMFDLHGSSQPDDVGCAIISLYALPAWTFRPFFFEFGDLLVT
jgi:hypothetical protein